MRKKRIVFIGLLLVCLMAGCAKEGPSAEKQESKKEPVSESEISQDEETATVSEDTGDQTLFEGKVLTGEEEALFKKLQEAVQEEVLLFECADFDGDGTKEAFAFTGSGENEVLQGRRWFVTKDGAQSLKPQAEDTEYLQKRSEIVQLPDQTALWVTESEGGSETVSWLWGGREGVPQECVLSGKGQDFRTEEDGSYVLYLNSTDVNEDGTGRSQKPCYFYYKDGAFWEYGALAVSWEQFLNLPGAQECVASYLDESYWIRDIFLRGNGLIQINLRNIAQNSNLTLEWKDQALAVKEENEGITGLLVGELASEEWFGPQGSLQDLWQERLAAERADGRMDGLRTDRAGWYDLDGDGVPEEIRYTVYREDPDDAYAKSVSLLVNQKEVWKREQEDTCDFQLWVSDVNREDGKKELILKGRQENDCISLLKIFDWENGRLTERGDLREVPVFNGAGNIFRIGNREEGSGNPMQIPGDGFLTLWADTPVYTLGLGSYYVKLSFMVSEKGIEPVNRAEYEVKVPYAEGQPYPYTVKLATPFYESSEKHPEGAPSFIAEPGEQMNCLAVAPAVENMVYAKMKRVSTGEVGWTLFSETELFEETPAWG